MTTPKKAAELQAEADAKAREEAAAEEVEKKRRQAGMFDWFKNLIPQFNFGSILMWGMMLTGIYFLAKSKIGQELIETLVGNFKPETQATILGFLDTIGIGVDMTAALEKMPFDALKKKLTDAKVPEPILAVVAEDAPTWKQFFTVVKEANTDAKGKTHVTLSSFTNDKTIFALMTKQPEMALALASAASKLPPSADGKPSDTAKQISAAIKAIVTSDRLNVLLDADHRQNTLRIFTAGMPVGLPIKPEAIASFINQTGFAADGKPTAALTGLITAVTQGPIAATSIMPTITNYILNPVVANNPQTAPAIRTLFASIDRSKITRAQDAQLQDLQKMLTPQGLVAMSNIQSNGVDPVKLGAAFTVTAADGHSQPSGPKTVQNLLSADARAVIRKAGIANLAVMTTQMSPVLTPYNLLQLLKLGDDIDRIDANKTPANRARNLDVIGAFANLTQPGVKPADAFRNVDANELAGFFAVQGNKNAVYSLLHNLNTDAMPQQQRNLIGYLVKHPDIFGTVDDTKSATVMLGLLKGENGSFANLLGDWGKEQKLQRWDGFTATESQTVVGLGNLLNSNAPPPRPSPPRAPAR